MRCGSVIPPHLAAIVEDGDVIEAGMAGRAGSHDPDQFVEHKIDTAFIGLVVIAIHGHLRRENRRA